MTGVVSRSKEVTRVIVDLGYSHYGKGIEEGDMPKMAAAILAGIEDLLGNENKDNRDTLAAWKKYLDFITVQFNTGLRRAATDASGHVSASLPGEEEQHKEEEEQNKTKQRRRTKQNKKKLDEKLSRSHASIR